jgi:hypothetical protein
MSVLTDQQDLNREISGLTLKLRDLAESGLENSEEYDKLLSKKKTLKERAVQLSGNL